MHLLTARLRAAPALVVAATVAALVSTVLVTGFLLYAHLFPVAGTARRSSTRRRRSTRCCCGPVPGSSPRGPMCATGSRGICSPMGSRVSR